MKINAIGEFQLINRFVDKLKYEHEIDHVGIGDDCSVTPCDRFHFQISTTDLLIEDIHFLINKTNPEHLGQKAIEVGVSDIAAMGGSPLYAYLSIGAPKELDLAFLEEIFCGIQSSCERYKIKVMGGDTTCSPKKLIINVFIQGKVRKDRIKLRSKALPGDLICVSGALGDSKIGLDIILGKMSTNWDEYFVRKHNKPRAHLAEGQWLAQYSAVHGMMDVSDGLVSDIKHICNQSSVGARIDLNAIPVSTHAKKISAFDLQEIAAVSGEEYCLLFTMSASELEEINEGFMEKFGKPIYVIGEILKGTRISFLKNGALLKREIKGFSHFGE